MADWCSCINGCEMCDDDATQNRKLRAKITELEARLEEADGCLIMALNTTRHLDYNCEFSCNFCIMYTESQECMNDCKYKPHPAIAAARARVEERKK